MQDAALLGVEHAEPVALHDHELVRVRCKGAQHPVVPRAPAICRVGFHSVWRITWATRARAYKSPGRARVLGDWTQHRMSTQARRRRAHRAAADRDQCASGRRSGSYLSQLATAQSRHSSLVGYVNAAHGSSTVAPLASDWS